MLQEEEKGTHPKKKKYLYLEKFNTFKESNNIRLAKNEKQIKWMRLGFLLMAGYLIMKIILG